MDDIVVEFLAETNESMAELDNDLILLEQDPENEELISKIFRILHTIKGTCGFLGLPRLEKVAHKGEDVLGLIREKKLSVTPDIISLILEAFDSIKTILAGLEANGCEPEGDDSEVIKRLEAIYNGCGNEVASEEDSEHFSLKPEEDPSDTRIPNPQLVDQSSGQVSENVTRTLRVNVDVLEDLMTMVSELVLTRNQLLQISRQNKDSEFMPPLQRLNQVVSDLQEGVMKTRMQPIGNAWTKLPRIVRDVCTELGKEIELEMIGKDTELDRQIIDMIKDPLTHMIRNSADHGIEMPEERLAKGKPSAGKITLNAYHQGGHINIVISDDGKGLSLERIKKKIIQNGLASEEQLESMPIQKIHKYIFHAGFSTAEKITAVSGRGVGMDVVRSNIEKIGGSIELHSEEGVGTTFTVKIPLTLAIVSALIVGVGDQRFAIPQITISELVLVGNDSNHKIEKVNDVDVMRLRGKLLPLVSLSDLMGLERSEEDLQARYVVVTKVGSASFGLIVDHVFDLEEIVIKPLSRHLKNVPIYAGNTILGDGCVIMILDPAGILKAMGMTESVENKKEQSEEKNINVKPEHMLLLFKAGDETFKATPLDVVSRLEEVDISQIEYAKGQPVIQYLGHLMPIHNFDQTANMSEKRPLIILQHEGRNAGILADQILDITKYYGHLKSDAISEIVDSIIVNNHATDVVNTQMFTNAGVLISEGEEFYG